MKHTELKAFVRKYNSEFAIKGYSKMKKQQLTDTVIARLSKSRKEIKKEWTSLHSGTKPVTKKPAKKRTVTVDTKKQDKQKTAQHKADDAYHEQHNSGAGGDQGRKLRKAVSRAERRAKVQKDMKLTRRIRGK